MKEPSNFSPRSFMEQRRPDSFSDTQVIKESQLDSLTLEYRLSTLSTKKQEYDFEEFARKLCQCEIQPNLRPQTGPVGGGDGKVDTETTPVSEAIKDIYYFGVEKASNERWGFAFSTTVNWKTKVKGDVKKMIEVDRNYTKVFFVTSQFIKADQRAKVEDELSRQYHIPVVIHDRTWIIDKVFGSKRQCLAIEELKIDSSFREITKIGPKDTDRQALFEKLNNGIEEAVQEDRVNFAIVDDCISSAIIAAKMNKPKNEVEGFFIRSKRMAKKYGSPEQFFDAKYQEIWMMYFWYNDYDILINNYQEIESLTEGTVNIFAIERLSNLLNLLRNTAVFTGKVEDSYIEEKKMFIRERLQAFKDDESRPSASLQAEGLLQILEIPDVRGDQDAVSFIFDNLKNIVTRSTGLLGFPLETLYGLIRSMNDFYSGNKSFEELQDKLVDVISERKSSTESAHVLLERSIQHIEGKRFYKAIACLGKTLVPLYKEEERGSLIIALAHLSFAYETVGLLWAARAAMLHAASYATMDFHNAGEISKLQLLSYAQLRLLELRLGRVGYSLDWHRLNHGMNEQFFDSKEEKEKLLQDDMFYGAQLGFLLIKTPDSALLEVELLPDTLMNMDLDLAAYGLIYRLEGKKILSEIMPEKMADIELEEFFDSYMTHPSQRYLPQEPVFYSGEKVTLKTVILGTMFVIETENQSPNIEIGEYILASLEGFLATTMEMNSYGNKNIVKIMITRNSFPGVKVSYEVRKDESITFDIICDDFNPHSLKRAEQNTLYSDVSKVVLDIIGHSISFRDLNTDLEKLFRDENIGVRAFTFSSPLVVQGNVLGYKPKRDIKDWMSEENKRYEYNEAESGKLKHNLLANPKEDEEVKKEKKDKDFIRHDQMENVSIIEEHLWNDAGWNGVAYLTIPNKPPVIALMFTNEEKAKAIFLNWINQFGREDKDEIIRVVTIIGFTKTNPTWYKFVISTNMGDPEDSKGKLILNVGRTHTMTPQTLNNLNSFIDSYERWGYYLIAPSFIKDKKSFSPNIFFDHGIIKRKFVNKNAWEIGPMDPEIMGLRSGDHDPVIPEGVANPPILETIEVIKKNSGK